MKIIYTDLKKVDEIARAASAGMQAGACLTRAEVVQKDLKKGFNTSPGLVLSCKPSQESINTRNELLEQVCNEAAKHLEFTNGNVFPDFDYSEQRINVWSSRWRNLRWDPVSKDDNFVEKRSLKTSELKFKIDTYGSQNLREWQFDSVFMPKDGYRTRILPDVMNLEEDEDVKLLAKILYDKNVVREEVVKYLTSVSMAGTLYNTFIESKAAFGRAVVNSDTFSRTKLLKLISTQYSSVTDEEGRRELEAIVATLFLAETSCLGMISRGILKFKHYREELDTTRSNYRLGLECLNLAHIIKDYISKCREFKYENLLARGRRTDRLSDIFTLLYEEIRDGLTFKVRHILKIEHAITIVESLLVLKVLGVEGLMSSIAPDLLEDPTIEKLSRNFTLVSEILADRTKVSLAYTLRPDRSVIMEAIRIYGTVFEENLFFKTVPLAELLDFYTLKPTYTEVEGRRVGMIVHNGTTLLSKSMDVMARVSANVEKSYTYVDVNSYAQYSQFGNSEIGAASTLNSALDPIISESLSKVIVRGVLTNVSEEELQLIALALNGGKQRIFLEGELLKSELLQLHDDLGPVLKSEVPKVHFYYEYSTEGKLLDDIFIRSIVEYKRTTDAAEFLLIEAPERLQTKDFEVHGIDFRIASTKTQHLIPDSWFGFDIDTEFHFELEEVLTRNYSSSLKRLMYDTSRYGAKMTFDYIQYALRSRALEDLLFFEFLRRSFIKAKLDAQCKDDATKSEILARQQENFKNTCFDLMGRLIKASKFIKYTIVDLREIVYESAQMEHGEADIRQLPLIVNERLNTIKLSALTITNELFNVQDSGAISFMQECAAACEYYTEESIDGEV